MPIIVAMCALILGLALLIIGLRGKRLGDHPHCTACGFDLFGLPPDSKQCPECGADTRRLDAHVIGRHTRRHRPLISGLALLLPSIAYLSIVAAAIVAGVDLTPYKPVWWLASDATGPAAPLRKQAINELTTRLVANKLTGSDCDRLARSLLALQSSISSWYPECGDLLDNLHSSGSLSEEFWKQYAANAAPRLSLTVRPRVRLGDPIAYQIVRPAAPVGNKTQLAQYDLEATIRIGSLTIKRPGGSSSGISNSGKAWSTSDIEPNEYIGMLQPGRHRLTLIQRREIRIGSIAPAPALHADTVTLEADLDLLTPDQRTITLINDPDLLPALKKCMTPQLHTNRTGALDVNTDVQFAPVPIAFRVTVIAGNTRHDAGRIALLAGKQTSFSHAWIQNWTSDHKVASVLYEPDVEAAARTVDLFEIYNHSIEFDNVEIKPW